MTMLPFGDVAPIRRRVIAYVIDALIGAVIPVIGAIVMVMMTVSALSASDPAGVIVATLAVSSIIGVLTLAWFIVYTVMQAGGGSIGMRTQGIRLVNAADGAPLGFGRALLRNVIWGLAASIVVGYFTPLFDGSGRFQGWHDRVAGAMMLDARMPAHGAPATAPPQPRALPDSVPGGAEPRPEGAMPGFTAPSAATSMPGFAQGAPAQGVSAPGASAPAARAPGAGVAPSPPGSSDVVPPAPPVPPLPTAESPTTTPPDDDEFVEHTVLAPRIHRELPDDPLISFVPGVTQEPPQRPSAAEPAPPVAAEPAPPVAAEPAPPVAAEPAPPVAPQPIVAEPTAPAAPTAPSTRPTPSVPPAPPMPPLPPILQDAPAAISAPEDDLNDDDLESTRISVPGHRLVFTWDDGQRATVSGRTVFGRNPEDDTATNVAVRDETRSLSKTHFEAGSTTRGGWVMDRHSTNGTVVVSDGIRIACPPGQRVPVRLGDSLEIGDRIVTIGGYV